jgi:hypothetical protein
MSPQTISRLAALQMKLASEMAETYIRSCSHGVRQIAGEPPWRDTHASSTGSSEEEEVMLLSKEYLLLMGMLETHPSEPNWVRVVPGPFASRVVTEQ